MSHPNQPGLSNQRVPDLVRDSQLTTRFLADGGTQHIFHRVSSQSRHRRLARIEETWYRQQELGRGGFGCVWLEQRASSSATGRLRAVKEIRKTPSLQVLYTRELEAMAKFSHERYVHCFVQFYGWYESETMVFIAMEYIEHGDLKNYMGQPFLEAHAKLIGSQLVDGLQYMHENGFAHRDLKPENIFVYQPGPDWWVKIGDFGIAKRAEGTALQTDTGTKDYKAPEVRFIIIDPNSSSSNALSYTFAVDMWALGELLFRLMAQRPVFPNENDLRSYITYKQPFPVSTLKSIGASRDCCKFVPECMAPDPRDRLTASEAAEHRWVQVSWPSSPSSSHSTPIRVHEERPPVPGILGQIATPNPQPVKHFEDTGTWSTDLRDPQQVQDSWSTASTIKISAQANKPEQPQVMPVLSTTIADDHPNVSRKARAGLLPEARTECTSSLNRSLSVDKEKRTITVVPYPKGNEPSPQQTEASKTGNANSLILPSKGREVPRPILAKVPTRPATPNPQLVVHSRDTARWSTVQQVQDGRPASSTISASAKPKEPQQLLVRRPISRNSRASSTLHAEGSSSQPCESVNSASLSADGQPVALGSGDKAVKNWDFTMGRCMQTLKGHSDTVWSVAFLADGQRVASGSGDKTVKIWDAATGGCVQTLKGYYGAVWSVAFSADGQRVALGSWEKAVEIWDVATGRCVQTLKGHSDTVWSVAFSADGQRVASGSGDETVKIWDVTMGRCMQMLKGHGDTVWSVAFFSDGQRIASGSGDKTVKIWDAATGRCVQTLEGHSGAVWSVACLEDGQRVASGSHDRKVKIWDVATGRCVQTLQGHSGAVTSIALSADGQRVASGSYDETVKIWDVTMGRCVQTLKGHSNAVTSVAFSPGSQRVASGSYDKTVNIWDAATGSCLVI